MNTNTQYSAPSPARSLQVAEQMNEEVDALNGLHAATDELEKRLEPFLAPATEAKGVAANLPILAPHAAALREHVSQIRGIVGRIRELLSRLEI